MGKPKVRFKGYTDDWEQRKLSDIADKVTEKNKANKFDEAFTNSAEQGIISQKDYFDRDIVNEDNLGNYYIVRNNDFVYNPRISVTAPVGPINRNRLGRNGVMSPLYTVFRTKNIELLYLEYYFKTTIWHRFMKLNGDSGARFDRFTIGLQTFMEMPIPYPCIAEQKKVGAYFEQLDHLITLHQRKYENLQKLKKYMLQKMFPQNGTNVPEIRFQGFQDAWEQRKVLDIAPLQRGFDLPSADIKQGKYPVVMSNGIGSYHSEYKTKGPGVVTGRSGTIGKLHYIEDDYWPHNTTLWVTNFKGNNPKFIYYMFQCLDLSRFSTGSGVPTLNRNDVHDTVVAIPSVDEQIRISEYLTIIDHLITLHQHKCEELKNMKKFMLQNMFVQEKQDRS